MYQGSNQHVLFFASDIAGAAYLQVQKCACTTFKNLICILDGKIIEQPFFVHDPNFVAAYSRSEQEISEGNYFKFTFVRSPFARFASFYKDKILKWDDNLGKKLSSDGIYRGMGVPELLTVLENIGPDNFEIHLRPMYKTIYDQAGRNRVDFVGRLEFIEKDFCYVREMTGFSGDLPRLNRSNTQIDDYLDSHAKRRLRKIYQEDFEIFQY